MLYRYVGSRLGQSLIVLFGAVAISFALTNLIGKPSDVLGGPFMTADQRAALNAQLGYDQPVLPRFGNFLVNLVTGDFGVSYRSNENAMTVVMESLPNTLVLVLSALLLASAISLVLAIFSVRHREGVADRALRRSVGVFQGMPNFWLALMLILLLSVQVPLLPSFGFNEPAALVLPMLAMAIPIVPIQFRIFRGQLLDVMGKNFVEAMRARGLSERSIVYRHGLRNMVGPAVTLTALQLGYLIGGSLVVETVFSWPGIGNLVVSAVQARDFAVVQAIIIVVAAFYVLLNLVADVVVLLIDPRTRKGTA
ncbi:ABC transporter permease [Amycolatopsis thermoflava]|uniref:ABC transporter permease n=1 Tax=Amycolatopsis thermoflava TaxID=84480 RepID=UPI00041F2303|nr:ABC transporter permease [Amycolatopsis thermoflava]